MSLSTLALPLAFLALSSCVLWILSKSSGAVWIKSTLVITTIFLGVSTWSTLGSLEGWPASNPPNKSFELHSALIVEPNNIIGEVGRIYLWITPQRNPDRSVSWVSRFKSSPDDEPRAYRIPYDKTIHKQIEEARKLMKKGQRVMMTLKKNKKDKKGNNGQNRYKAELWYPLPPISWNKPNTQKLRRRNDRRGR